MTMPAWQLLKIYFPIIKMTEKALHALRNNLDYKV